MIQIFNTIIKVLLQQLADILYFYIYFCCCLSSYDYKLHVWYIQTSFLKSLWSVKPNKWHKFFSTKIHLFSLTQTTGQVIKLYYVEQYITHKHIHDTIVAHYFWHHWNLYDVPHVTEKKKIRIHFSSKGLLLFISKTISFEIFSFIILTNLHRTFGCLLLFWKMCTCFVTLYFFLWSHYWQLAVRLVYLCAMSHRAKSSQNDNCKIIYCVSVVFHIIFI